MIVTFAVIELIVLSCVFVHVLRMKDVAMAHEWLCALPSIFGGLTALCGMPYRISRAGASISEFRQQPAEAGLSLRVFDSYPALSPFEILGFL